MRVIVLRNGDPKEPLELWMTPEGAKDELSLETLIGQGLVAGYGRHATTGRVLHAQLPLLSVTHEPEKRQWCGQPLGRWEAFRKWFGELFSLRVTVECSWDRCRYHRPGKTVGKFLSGTCRRPWRSDVNNCGECRGFVER